MAQRGSELRKRPALWTVRLGRCLRSEGVPCTLTESVAALEALGELDLEDSLDTYLGLKTVFLSARTDEPTFDRVFWAMWEGRRVGDSDTSPVHLLKGGRSSRRRIAGEPRPPPAEPLSEKTAVSGHRGALQAPERVLKGVAWSPVERLATRSFTSLDEAELRALDRAFDRLIVKLATRKSRRLRPVKHHKGKADFRRTFRHALRHDGEMLPLAYRNRRIERPRVVLLCDVSGSMERYSRFVVHFLLATRRTRDVETFVFSTRLVRLTRWLRRSHIDDALAAISERVPGWSGGTRIGASLETFLDRWGRTRSPEHRSG